MKRWTRNARDFEYPDEVCTSAGEQLGQNLLYANALDVVKSTDKNPKAVEILMKYLHMAKKEIDSMPPENLSYIASTDGNSSAAQNPVNDSETEGGCQTGYESNGQQIITNTYGAAGSSAYMSDAEIREIQAPLVPQHIGKQRENRYKPIFEKIRRGRKCYRAYDENGETNNARAKTKKSKRHEGFASDD
jgi:hypothetical protein